jgi:hypothetical protein
MNADTDDLEFQTRLTALKKAHIVMNGLADSISDESTKAETKTLAWAISWAVTELASARSKQRGAA